MNWTGLSLAALALIAAVGWFLAFRSAMHRVCRRCEKANGVECPLLYKRETEPMPLIGIGLANIKPGNRVSPG